MNLYLDASLFKSLAKQAKKLPHPGEIEEGVREEKEHTRKPRVALKIALDHLKEDPRYYTKLKRMMRKARVDETRGRAPASKALEALEALEELERATGPMIGREGASLRAGEKPSEYGRRMHQKQQGPQTPAQKQKEYARQFRDRAQQINVRMRPPESSGPGPVKQFLGKVAQGVLNRFHQVTSGARAAMMGSKSLGLYVERGR